MATRNDGTTRRSFLVKLGGFVLGRFFLPPISEAEKAPARRRRQNLTPDSRKLLLKPSKRKTGDGFMLLWSEEDEKGEPRLMVWTPETPQEIADAEAFYNAARDFRPPGNKTGMRAREERFRAGAVRSPEEERLLAAIRADLAADGPRLAYAAWLTKRGNPRGAFIEADVLTENMDKADPRYDVLSERYGELMEKHGEEWVRPLTDLGLVPEILGEFFPQIWFTRGMIEELEIDRPDILPEKADQLFRAAPVLHRLNFDYEELDTESIVSLPHMSQVTALDFHWVSVDRDAFMALANSPLLWNLKELALHDLRLDADAARQFLKSKAARGLKHLTLHDCPFEPDVARIFAAASVLKDLEVLELEYSGHDASKMIELGRSPHFTKIRSLIISRNQIGDNGLAALAVSKAFPSLTELNLNSCGIGTHGIKALVSSPLPSRLTKLDLSCNSLGMEGVSILVRTAKLRGLRSINLSQTELGPEGIEAVAASPHLSSLEVLRLDNCVCGTRGAAALGSSRNLSSLQQLSLFTCELGESGAKILAGTSQFANLKRLWVDEDDVGPKGLALLQKRFGDDTLGSISE